MFRCHGLRVYAVCVCNKVRLPGTGQSAHVIGGSRFTRPASNSRRTLSASHTGTTHGPRTEKVAILASASSFAGCASPCATRASSALDQRCAFVVVRCVRRDFCACTKLCAELDARMYTPEGRQPCAERAGPTPDTRGAHAEHTRSTRWECKCPPNSGSLYYNYNGSTPLSSWRSLMPVTN